MEKNLTFRGWFYFRTGWATYFAFIVAAVNALTVTFFLAIDKYPTLSVIFSHIFSLCCDCSRHWCATTYSCGICTLQEI